MLAPSRLGREVAVAAAGRIERGIAERQSVAGGDGAVATLPVETAAVVAAARSGGRSQSLPRARLTENRPVVLGRSIRPGKPGDQVIWRCDGLVLEPVTAFVP